MKRKTIIAVGAFVVLGGLGLWLNTREPARGIARIDLSQVDTSQADKIVLTGAHTAQLLKEGENWTLEGKLAATTAVDQLLASVPKIQSSALVTRSKERYADYEVDDEKGVAVEIYRGGDKLVSFVVGKAAAGGAHLRLDQEVFSVSGIFPRTFQKSGTDWLERKVFTFPQGDVTKVAVALKDIPPYELVRKEGAWSLDGVSLPEGFRFDTQAAGRLVSSLVNLRAKDILESDPGEETSGLGDPSGTLVLYGETGQQLGKLELGAQDAETQTTYVRAEGRPHIMTVHGASAQALRKAPLDFRSLTLMSLDSAAVTKLDIRSPQGHVLLENQEGAWTVVSAQPEAAADFQLDPAAVTRRLSALANARALGVVEASPASAGLVRPKATVTATLQDGSAVSLRLGNTTQRDNREVVFAAGNADDAVYTLALHTQTSLTGLLPTFAQQQTPAGPGPDLSALDPAALQNLPPEVRRSLEEQIRQQAAQRELLQQLQAQQAQ